MVVVVGGGWGRGIGNGNGIVVVSWWCSSRFRQSNDSSGSSGSSDSRSTNVGRRNNSNVFVGETRMRRKVPKKDGTDCSSQPGA